jgi:hypothetical protein
LAPAGLGGLLLWGLQGEWGVGLISFGAYALVSLGMRLARGPGKALVIVNDAGVHWVASGEARSLTWDQIEGVVWDRAVRHRRPWQKPPNGSPAELRLRREGRLETELPAIADTDALAAALQEHVPLLEPQPVLR